MDWAALGSREAVLAVCARFRVDFAQAEDYLLARQLGQAEERAEADEQEEEEEEEDDDEGEQEDEGTTTKMRRRKRRRRRRRRKRRRSTRTKAPSFRCRGRTL